MGGLPDLVRAGVQERVRILQNRNRTRNTVLEALLWNEGGPRMLNMLWTAHAKHCGPRMLRIS